MLMAQRERDAEKEKMEGTGRRLVARPINQADGKRVGSPLCPSFWCG